MEKMKREEEAMDKYLRPIGKTRKSVARDGHCIGRSVLDCLHDCGLRRDIHNYKDLLRMAKDDILGNLEAYAPFISDQADVKKDLEAYLLRKSYSREIVDLVLIALTNALEMTVNVHYVYNGEVLKTCLQPIDPIKPRCCIDVSFSYGHYEPIINICSPIALSEDIICISDSPVKQSRSTNFSSEACPNKNACFVKSEYSGVKMEFDQGVKQEEQQAKGKDPFALAHETDIINLSDSESDISCSDEVSSVGSSVVGADQSDQEEDVKFQGKRRYINPLVFESVPIEVEKTVPQGVDGIRVFQLPTNKDGSLQHCKGGRPWGKWITSASSHHRGKRMIANCKGSYTCMNSRCDNLADFGINRQEFAREGKKILCEICGSEAVYIECDARLIIEKNKNGKTIVVKHYGTHTCKASFRGRMEKEDIKDIIEKAPKMTRETMIRQGVQKFVEEGDLGKAKELAASFTDRNYIENVKRKSKMSCRPFGHSFQAVKKLKETYDKTDKYLIFDLHDGEDGKQPFVIKSSSLKVEMMSNMDKDGSHPLSKETCFLDVTFKRCKGWPTYTLSYYNKLLRQMVKLATMECEKESGPNCALFLGKINEMVQSYPEGKNRGFNPFHIRHDEHGGNPIGISSVLGEDALSRTSSCEFHYNDSVKKHRRYVLKEDRRQYEALLANLKNAVTKEAYNAVKSKLQALIDRQRDGDRKPLQDALSFWHKAKHRWARAFRPNLHCDFTSSLAEVAHASMMAGGDVGGSLVDAAIADTADGMRLAAKWENRSRGEVHSGTGPSGLTLASRNARQQEARADKFISETEIDRVFDPHFSDECNTAEGVPEDIQLGRPDFDPCRTHRPDKRLRLDAKQNATEIHLACDLYSDSDEDSHEAESDQMTTALVGRKRQRSLSSKTFLSALKRAEKFKDMITLHHIEKSESQSIFKIREDGKNYTVTISDIFKCSCPYQLAAKKRTCSHILWCFLTVLKVSKDNPVLAQLEVGNEMLQDLLRIFPIPSRKICFFQGVVTEQ